ncbi:MAG: hypothetical protein H6945_08365 [Zoogloeaceae bacterium]|nr:hypothetical protein [Rhodocyclaceae bacterium]MCP5235736.1 hypothetical protein [Zoogloeaceae bacterium]
MATFQYQGERDVGEIADRVYGRLTTRQRDQAIAALLKANPELRDLRRLRPGTELEAPALPGLGDRPTPIEPPVRPDPIDRPEPADQPQAARPSPDDTDAGLAGELLDALGALQKTSEARFDNELRRLKDQQATLGSAELARLVAADPALAQLAERVAKDTEARASSVDRRREALTDIIRQAAVVLEKGRQR